MHKRTLALGLGAFIAAGGLTAYSFAQPAGKPGQPAQKAQKPEEKEDDEVQIKLSEAPEAVRTAALKLTSEKNITKVTRESDDGISTFEVEFNENGSTSSGTFSAAGDVLEVEHGVTQDKVPAAAMAAVKKENPGVSFGNIVIVTKTFYEVEVVKDGKKHEVVVNAAGDIEHHKHQQAGGKEEDEKGEHDKK
jgi:uncharacterized membrane protein YkoI